MGGGGKASAELCYVKKFMSKVQPFRLIERGGEASLNFFMWKKYYFLAEPQGGLGRPKVLTFSNILFWRHPLHRGNIVTSAKY